MPRARAVLASEDAVAEELPAAHREQFAAALGKLEGRAEFVVHGRYLQDAVAGEALAQNQQAARLRDTTQGQHPGAARQAGTGPGEIITEAVTARREQDTRTLAQAIDGHCVASVARQPADQLDAVHVAFLAEAGQQGDMERVAEDLARVGRADRGSAAGAHGRIRLHGGYHTGRLTRPRSPARPPSGQATAPASSSSPSCSASPDGNGTTPAPDRQRPKAASRRNRDTGPTADQAARGRATPERRVDRPRCRALHQVESAECGCTAGPGPLGTGGPSRSPAYSLPSVC
jgi:hypothetical protein